MPRGADREMEALSGSGSVEVRVHREEESLLILINHCREMKQQEARLRLITLLLLLGCAAAFIFISCADFSQRRAAVRAADRGRPDLIQPAEGSDMFRFGSASKTTRTCSVFNFSDSNFLL